ncbi:MAG: transcriptional regulator NrdR [Lactobacillus sp.]|jgi:transcriptional repressor NrdR|nr:transcriptional regulator NrdR [Lactobacillus sp.]MCI1481031.1 transcriptional regulator NrdR [Lactobacillus sp.]
MICPHCHQNSSHVLDSRPTSGGEVIRRHRECERCGYRFTTFERVEHTPLLVIKNDGTREPFQRQKILRGLLRAAEKRPISSQQLNEVVDHVESVVRKDGQTEVTSKEIGQLVMDNLAELDDVAYIRFASVYRQFTDVSGFMKTLYDMMAKRQKES